MATFEQKIAAEVLRERCKELLRISESKKIPKELEAERLYFWILRRIAYEIEETYPTQRSYKMVIEEKYPFAKEETVLVHCYRNVEEYHSRYVHGKDFNDVLIRVKCSLSSMDGYNSYVMQPHNDKQKAILIVTVEL